jgi:hypothetical protein
VCFPLIVVKDFIYVVADPLVLHGPGRLTAILTDDRIETSNASGSACLLGAHGFLRNPYQATFVQGRQ